MTFVGIDLTSSAARPSAIAVLGVDSRIISLDFPNTDNEIIATIGRTLPLLIAIDAPLSLPLGLCCLKEDCPCQQASQLKGRVCERLLAQLGAPCFFTTKKSIIRGMAERAIALKGVLFRRGYEVIEVYPYATKVRLFGKPIPKKTTPEGLDFLKRHLSRLIPSLATHLERLNHDLCDAILAAYTAYLYHQGSADAIGDPEEGVIIIPSGI